MILGVMEVHGADRARLVDPLALLPDPTDDLQAQRTWPGAPSHGLVHFEALGEGRWRFYTVLPERFGAVGRTRHGLFANGAWYPQLVAEDGLPTTDWEVELRLPEGHTGALGSHAGGGTLRWTGRGERVALAVIPDGRLTLLHPEGHLGPPPWLLTRRRPSKVVVRELEAILAQEVGRSSLSGGVVVAPLRRRLVRPGPELAFLSNRAFRVTPGTRRFHRVAVARGIYESRTAHPSPGMRSLQGALEAQRYARGLSGTDAEGLLRWGAWMPSVDRLLNDRTMPFAGEVLEATLPWDPVQDDLVEVLDPHVPGTAVAAWIQDLHGPIATDVFARALLEGASLDRAVELAEIDPDLLEGLTQPWPEQDYTLELDLDPPQIRVERHAPEDAPPEVVVVRVDGQSVALPMGPGPDHRYLPIPERPHRVVLDPDQHVQQTTRLGDSWPRPWTLTATAGVTGADLSEGYLFVDAAAWLRRRHDTRNTLWGTLYTSQSHWVVAGLGYSRKFGPLLDGLRRAHTASVWVSPGLMSGRYSSVEAGQISLAGGASWSWDTRVHRDFPLRGHRLGLSGDGGLVPGSDLSWWAVHASATGVTSPHHTRHAFAGRASASLAQGDVDHELLSLGGLASLRSQPAGGLIGTRRLVAASEYRWVPIRHASVPILGLLWATELQLTAGAEAAVVWRDGEPIGAGGVTTGIAAAGDWFGFESAMVGVTAGWPVWAPHSDTEDDWKRPQLYLRWAQAY